MFKHGLEALKSRFDQTMVLKLEPSNSGQPCSQSIKIVLKS